MSGGPLVVVGDALLDRDLDGQVSRVAPDAPVPVVEEPSERARPGGAGLAAALAAADVREVVLVTALARDDAGQLLARLLARAGVTVIDVGLDGATPEKVRVRAAGQPLLRVDRGGRPGRPGALDRAGRRALEGAGAVLVADYGRGVAAEPTVRAAVAGRRGRVPLVWDPHPRGAQPLPGALLATPNQQEAAHFAPRARGATPGRAQRSGADGGRAVELAEVSAQAQALTRRWRAAGVVVTLGARGALLVTGAGSPLMVPAVPSGGDPCGAGDRFAATATALLADGALPSEAVTGAVAAASAYVAGDHQRPRDPVEAGVPAGGAAEAVAAAVRARGGTVVATGGCFDLLHTGHLATLRAARALGDCLIVCLNSDASVTRLKGPGRPVVPAAERLAMLTALECVDAAVVFDEDTPAAVLDRLRPDIFAKGGDYTLQDLPEAELLASWGGQAVILPYLSGRSTTGLIHKAATNKAR